MIWSITNINNLLYFRFKIKMNEYEKKVFNDFIENIDFNVLFNQLEWFNDFSEWLNKLIHITSFIDIKIKNFKKDFYTIYIRAVYRDSPIYCKRLEIEKTPMSNELIKIEITNYLEFISKKIVLL